MGLWTHRNAALCENSLPATGLHWRHSPKEYYQYVILASDTPLNE